MKSAWFHFHEDTAVKCARFQRECMFSKVFLVICKLVKRKFVADMFAIIDNLLAERN